MNDRHRQIEKARRALCKAKTTEMRLIKLLTGIDWQAFNDAISAAAQSVKELAARAADAFRDFKPPKLDADALLAAAMAKCELDAEEGKS